MSAAMHPKLVDKIVEVCRQREAEGDCPTVPAFTVEQLEDAVIALADDRQHMLTTLAEAMRKFAPDLTEELRRRFNVASGRDLLKALQNQPST